MVTEQEVVEYLNEASKNKEGLKEDTKRYIEKLKELERVQSLQQDELASLRSSLKTAEENLLKTRGAISVILEMAAETEGLFKQPPENPDSSTDE